MEGSSYLYEGVPPEHRPAYAVSVAHMALSDIASSEARALAERAVRRASAWCHGDDVGMEELADLIHDSSDRGLDILFQEARQKAWSYTAAIEVVLCAVTYVAWRANRQKPPVLSLFDSVSDDALAYMEEAALQCKCITPALLQSAAFSISIGSEERKQ